MKKAKKRSYRSYHRYREGLCLEARKELGAEFYEHSFCYDISGRLFKELCRAAGIGNGLPPMEPRWAYDWGRYPLVWFDAGTLQRRVVSWRERLDLPAGAKIFLYRRA